MTYIFWQFNEQIIYPAFDGYVNNDLRDFHALYVNSTINLIFKTSLWNSRVFCQNSKVNDFSSNFVTLVDFSLKIEVEEWAEYEEKKTDYTNLKIDTLKLDEADPNDDGDDVNEDGEKVKKSKEGDPWSKRVASDSLDKDDDDEKTPGNLKYFFIDTHVYSKT